MQTANELNEFYIELDNLIVLKPLSGATCAEDFEDFHPHAPRLGSTLEQLENYVTLRVLSITGDNEMSI